MGLILNIQKVILSSDWLICSLDICMNLFVAK